MPAETPENKAWAGAAWLRAMERTAAIGADPTLTLPRVVASLAAVHGDAPALLSATETLSFCGLDARANSIAHWLRADGLRRGDVVCLLMPNRPDYLATWLGILRAGGIAALLNTSLPAAALAHAIRIVEPKVVIADGADLTARVHAVRHAMAPTVRLWSCGGASPGFGDADRASSEMPGTPVTAGPDSAPGLDDVALYIYTSGTTGLPKAARVSHRRILHWSHWFAGMLDTQPADRMYNVLPMYHAVGGVVATGATLVNGGSVLLAERFSVRRFWDDIVSHDCTLFQYIGDLCRYLERSPPHALETRHRLRLVCGNGLAPSIWQPFKDRFQIPRILEFYAATEGSFSLYNCEGRPGAIGRIPPYLRRRMPVVLVRHDVPSGLPVRGADGLCMMCATDEAGEALGRIGQRGGGTFEGYTDAGASGAKIVRDVVEHGDSWFRTGDLMRRDADGFYAFVDRIGDTFRWKGENVSTTEVANRIVTCPGVTDATVYGVTVPGADGRAGMAAIVAGEGFDLNVLWQHLADGLPIYARPLFVRLVTNLDATTTFKPRKTALQGEAYDPVLISDPLYYNDQSKAAFVRLDDALYTTLTSTLPTMTDHTTLAGEAGPLQNGQ